MNTTLQPFLAPAAALLLALASAAHAQDDLQPGVMDMTADENVVAGEISEEPDALVSNVDPIVQEDISSLRSSGVVEMQARIGQDLVVIDRLQRRAEALQGMIATVGVEGLKQFDAELYEALKDSPLVLNQMIEEEKLRRELEKAKAGDEADTDQPVDPAALDPLAFFQQGGMGAMVPQQSAPFPEPVVEVEESLVTDDVPMPVEEVELLPTVSIGSEIVLREVYGSADSLKAIISHGSEDIRVEAGDMLPNDTEIKAIFENRITVRRGDQIFEVFLRG